MAGHTLLYWGCVYLAMLHVIDADNEVALCAGDPVVSLKLDDSMQTGDVILNFTDAPGDINVACPGIFQVSNQSIILTTDLKNYCIKVSCGITCPNQNNLEVKLDGTVVRKENYTLRFVNDSYTAEIPELSERLTKLKIDPPVGVYIEECVVSDGVITNDFRFHLKDGEGMFVWNSPASTDSLILDGVPDYERKHLYHLQLDINNIAFNGIGSTNIKVNIIDVDDQDPTFDHDTYQLNITEQDNSTVDMPLTTTPPIYAFDQDTAINTSVIYSISDQEVVGLFTIDNTTGQLSVTRILDRETKSSYNILIKAVQTDDSFRSATARVIVNVEDIDDNIPQFDQDQYNVSINEHVSGGTVILIVKATDKDQGANAMFTYKLKNSSYPVFINANNGELAVADSNKFDRESFENGIMDIQVETVPTNPNSPGDVTNVSIQLIDINDHNPAFVNSSYTFNVMDSTGAIGQVHADDPDAGPNADVTYSFIESLHSQDDCTSVSTKFPFIIDPISGNITVTGQMFCRQYSTIIQACDNPLQISTRRCSSTTLFITHNSTQTTRNVSQMMDVLENSPLNTTVDVIQCQGTTYRIKDDNNEFVIEQATGLVLTNTNLDRESSVFHYLVVDVLDIGNTEILCQVNLTIQVLDINDNVPVFQHVDGYVFNLQQNHQQNIGTVQASDADYGRNADVVYSLQNKREHRFFINETTGEIFAVDPEDLDIDIVRLLVQATDRGIPSLTATDYIFILPVNQPVDLIPIKSPMTKEEIEGSERDIQSELQNILGTQIEIQRYDNLDTGTMLQVKQLNQTVSRRIVLSTIVDNYDQIRSLFYTSESRPVIMDSDKDEFGAAEIGLIVMGAVVLVALILAIVVVRKQCNRAEKYQHLYESLTRNSSIYESQEIKVKMDDESSQLNGIINSEDISVTADFVASATVNPAYQDGDITEVKQTQTDIDTEGTKHKNSIDSSETSVEEAIDQLDQLSDRLEQEEGDNGNIPVYANVNKKEFKNNSENASVNSIFLNESEDQSVVEQTGDNVDKDINQYENVPNSLAMRVLQAKSSSPIMARKQNTSDIDDDNNGDADEPDPDYENKQVRFTTEVVVADGGKVAPPSKSTNDEPIIADGENENENDTHDTIDEHTGEDHPAIPSLNLGDLVGENDEKVSGDLSLESEISSPHDVVNDTDTNDFFFGADEETTHF